MTITDDIAATSAHLSARTNEQADRMRISQKFAFEHDRRSQGQKHRQLCERVARIYEELAQRLNK